MGLTNTSLKHTVQMDRAESWAKTIITRLLATDTTMSSYRRTKHLNVRYKMVALQYLFTHHH